MGTIRFELRTEKLDKYGRAPIRLIYQISGQRKYYSTGQKTFSQTWDSTSQQVIYLDKKAAKKVMSSSEYELLPTEKQAKEINGKLADLRKEIEVIEHRFELDKVVYSAEMVINTLFLSKVPITKKEAANTVLFEFIDKYIVDHKTTREASSLAVYKSLKRHLSDFQRHTKKKVTFDKLDYSFFQSFQDFLITGSGTTVSRKGETVPRTPLNNTTVAKQLKTIKTFVGYAKKQGITVSDSYKDFKIKNTVTEVIALTNEEFETLYYLDLSNNKRLAQVRDIFCFACTTGLRYSDLNQLKREHIKEDEIRLTIKKTKEMLSIPLTPYSKSILTKYEALYRPLPIISSQKLNAYLKELCMKAEIKEPIEIVRFRGAKREAKTYPKYELIGVHTGRKTFATLSLERGMSAEEVMTITGHKDYHSFKRYVKITEQRKKVVMLKAWGEKVSDVKLKAV
jgi:integrase